MDFAEAFDKDLHDRGFEQGQVCAMISEGENTVLTSAAISNWKKRNIVPQHRLERLVQIFGPDSHLAQYAQEQPQIPKKWVFTRSQLLAQTQPQAAPPPPPEQVVLKLAPPTALEQAFVMKLPEHLRNNIDGGALLAGSAVEFDYLSDKAVLEFKRIEPKVSLGKMDLALVYPTVIHLLLAAKEVEGRKAILVIFNEADTGVHLPGIEGMLAFFSRKLVKEASALGIHVMVDPSAAEVVDAVIAAERNAWNW